MVVPAHRGLARLDSCGSCGSGGGFGVPQHVPPHRTAVVGAVLEQSATYAQDILVDPRYAAVRNECRNHHADCSLWALGDRT